MAGRGDPQRDHAQAVPVRGNRRDRGGDDHLDPGSAAHRAQLGLPLLLAARCDVRGARAQPPGRDAQHGGLPALRRQRRLRRWRTAAAAAVRHRFRARAGRGGSPLARRLPWHGSGAARQPGLAAEAARRVRQRGAGRDPAVLRPPPRPRRRCGDIRPARTARRTRLCAARPARCGPVGVPRARRSAHLFQRDVLGGLRPVWPRSPPTSGWTIAPRTGASAPTTSTPASSTTPTTRSSAISSRRTTATASTPRCCCSADLGFVKPDDPRFVRTVEAIGRNLKHGDALFRYVAPDDFGSPETSFTICTFWYIDALALIGRARGSARAVRAHPQAPQSTGPAVGGPGIRGRRGLGQFSADVFARRPDHRGDAAVAAVAGCGVSAGWQ